VEISVIYPACNEESMIRDTITRSLTALRGLFQSFEILILDDGSRDRTGELADALAAEHPEVRVIHNPRNLGQGETARVGFREASGDLVTHNAIDYPFDLRDLRLMLPLLDEADVVVAARREYAGYTAYRRVLSRVNVWLLHLLFPLRLRDYNFIQLYRRAVLEQVKPASRSTAFLTPEILIRAHDLGFRIREIEVEYHPRRAGVATAGRPKVILTSLRDMLNLWLHRGRRRRPAAGRKG
jgi:glycosyltransferase involved in cell wall biosynthesis